MPTTLTPDQISTSLKALADPNRLRIFERLTQGDSCNCELRDELGLAPNLLSHHLNVLSKAGLIHSRRDRVDGRWIYYAIDGSNVSLLRDWLLHLLDVERVETRPVLCGPEGQLAGITCQPEGA
ncbi:MAG: metalloregulator ArsR/SmtB family transcription factor [Anaerolineae bacterium]|nr:metalloregulator ArsR/SmtB family transcription factor [Anaerolineae bacterium]